MIYFNVSNQEPIFVLLRICFFFPQFYEPKSLSTYLSLGGYPLFSMEFLYAKTKTDYFLTAPKVCSCVDCLMKAFCFATFNDNHDVGVKLALKVMVKKGLAQDSDHFAINADTSKLESDKCLMRKIELLVEYLFDLPASHPMYSKWILVAFSERVFGSQKYFMIPINFIPLFSHGLRLPAPAENRTYPWARG